MKVIYKPIGKDGRTTIPEEIRDAVGITYNDIISFELLPNDSIVIKKVKVCDNCRTRDDVPLVELLKPYDDKEKTAALLALSTELAKKQGGVPLA